MRPLTLELLERYWDYVEDDREGYPMMDVVQARYSEWEESVQIFEDGSWTEQTFLYFGMRHEISGKPHGPVRKVSPDGHIYEGCYKQGKAHGFSRDL